MKQIFKIMDISGIKEYPSSAIKKLEGFNYTIEQNSFDSDEELIHNSKNIDVLLVTGTYITRSLLDRLPNLRAIIRYGVGLDRIDITAAIERGIIVRNVKDFCTTEIADYVLAIILNFNRNIMTAQKSILSDGWQYVGKNLHRLTVQKLGIIGMGNIGSALAQRGNMLGMSVLGYDPYVKKIKDIDVKLVNLDILLKESDYISIHCPLTRATKALIGEQEFKLMKKTSIIINTSRGAIIEETALINALRKGLISGAGLDVLELEPPLSDNPLLTMDNVIITPHISWYSEEAKSELIILAFEELAKILRTLSNP